MNCNQSKDNYTNAANSLTQILPCNTIVTNIMKILAEIAMADISPRISVEYALDATVVTFTDERILEEKDIRELEQSLSSVIEQADGVNLVLNFCNVKFLSSAVLGLLIKISKRIYERDGRLALCGISPKIHEIFKITRLTKIFDIHKDVNAAIDRISEKA